MLIQTKIGSLADFDPQNREVDVLELEYYETTKRILHKATRNNRFIDTKFLQEQHQLNEGDVLFIDNDLMIVVEIVACECIVIQPQSTKEWAAVCYEIGNKHAPLYFEEEQLAIPFEIPLYNQLQWMGFKVNRKQLKLLHPIKTSVAPHGTGNRLAFSATVFNTETPNT